MDKEALLKIQLEQMRQEHRTLDEEIIQLRTIGTDSVTISRMKKRKLALKDQIARIEDKLYPDIIA
ncbi:MAG: DUF465 domain-containing protein [Pseudomonadota bacterium]